MTRQSWFIQISEAPYDLDWAQDGDRFIHLVFEGLIAELKDAMGYSSQTHLPTDDEPFVYLDFSVTSPTLRTHLCLLPTASGAYLPLIRSDEGPINSVSETSPWVDALLYAVERLGDEPPVHGWCGVIGPVGATSLQIPRVIGDIEIGGMSLRPVRSAFSEFVEGPFPSLSGATLRRSHPIVVRGEAPGYSAQVAREAAAETLNLLCGVVSLATDSPWRIRQMPHPGLGLDVDPDALPESPTLGKLPLPPENPEPLDEGRTLPGWIGAAFSAAETDAWLRQMIFAHYQGLQLEDDFPSFALVAYVGVIESIGSRVSSLSRCDCCANCPTKVGYARQFRDAIALVRSGEDAKNLEKLYSSRSQTAHEGRLHAGEERRGDFGAPRFFTQEAARLFRFTELWPLRGASRDLIIRCVMNGLSVGAASDS